VVKESDKRALTLATASTADLGFAALPAIVLNAGDAAGRRFVEFFVSKYRNLNTRAAYARAVGQFLDWVERRGVSQLKDIEPVVVAAYIEARQTDLAAPSVKQHLAAIRELFDWLVTGQVVPTSPATSVKGPKHIVSEGKTPVLSAEEARHLLDSIPTTTLCGLRDRALISIMLYALARVSAVCGMTVADVFVEGRRTKFRLHEKGGKRHPLVAHHTADEAVHAYLEATGLASDRAGPLFRTIDLKGCMTGRAMTRNDVFRMVKRRARRAELSSATCCHSFRATGITEYMLNGGTLAKAAKIAGHVSTRTTQLYDRSEDKVTLDEIERIRI
jgi:site-specific recombinase XerD